MRAARFISFWTGFCSLSLEIVWIRLYGYANQSTPQAFGFVLAVYLLGISVGAQWGKRICRLNSRPRIERLSLVVLCVCAVLTVLAPQVYRVSMQFVLDDLFASLSIFATAAGLSVLFPITHHLGTPEDSAGLGTRKGRHFSHVYLLNVLGAALGPLVTGYILLELFTLTQVFALLSGVLVLTAICSTWLYRTRINLAWGTGFLVAGAVPLVMGWQSAQDPHVFAREFASFDPNKVHAVLENRHGIITISKEQVRAPGMQSFADFRVFGGNVYDGSVNVDLERNSNGLHRPLAMHVLQPQAKRALVLGLSIGSWLTVLEGFPGLEHIDVIEINDGYMQMAQAFPPQARALQDPRVHLYVDDARRWLQYRPQERYDLILMNTTWHWRANISMLLSREMMQLTQQHLSPQGVIAFNATGSVDAFYTASQVFKSVRRYVNFIYAADWDCFAQTHSPQAWQSLSTLTIDGRPAFKADSLQPKEFSSIPFVPIEQDIEKLGRMPEAITDDNMLVEYKWGRRS
jgi:spermidine synthase